MDGETDDLVTVELWRIPREQYRGAGVRRGLKVERRTGKPRPHDHRQFGSGTGGAQDIGS